MHEARLNAETTQPASSLCRRAQVGRRGGPGGRGRSQLGDCRAAEVGTTDFLRLKTTIVKWGVLGSVNYPRKGVQGGAPPRVKIGSRWVSVPAYLLSLLQVLPSPPTHGLQPRTPELSNLVGSGLKVVGTSNQPQRSIRALLGPGCAVTLLLTCRFFLYSVIVS